ncbi:MAG: efflux RND transporter permease subunit [Rikenellaceae bacterium]|nr:efflux RND transporter permease subunit [Rikenellaceae bacterium]
MKIYEASVRKPISTILIFVGVMIFGLFSLNNLAVDMYPDLDYPAISVITYYDGANASEVETNVTRILEDNLNTVNNLKKLTSTSRDNISLITAEMEWGSDLNEAANDIRDVVGRVQSYLPDDVETPVIFKFSSSMIPVLVLSATADESYSGLYKILDDRLVNVLNRVDGVGAVSLSGEPTREVQVNVDPQKLDAYGLSVEQIGTIIAAENSNVPSGTLDIGNNTYNIKADVEFKDSDEIGKIVLGSYEGRTILLEDVAQVKDTLEKATMEVLINGRRGVIVVVQKQSGANTVAIVNKVMDMLPAIEDNLPPDIEIDFIMDGSESIVDSINSLSQTVMYAFIFVIIVVLFFLGRWRATFIIVLTIPVSLVVSFIYLYATGSTLNIISLSSLSIAIGMVVDDAIVVLENITSHIERGSSPKEAAIYATNEVWLAVIATTLTVVAVFLPLTMLSGMAGILFRELGWIVTLVVCVSTAAAITLTPMLSAYLLKADGGIHTYKGLGIIFKPIDKFLDNLDIWYAKLLTWSVRHRTAVIVLSFGIFGSSLFLLRYVPTEFFPPSDNAIITAEVQLQQNIGVEYTTRIGEQIREIINEKYPEIRLMSAQSGTTSNSNNTFAAMQNTASYIVSFRMRLPRASKRDRTIFEISELLRQDLDQIPEIREFKVEPGGSTGGSASSASYIELKVFGHDFDVTNDIANDLKDKLWEIDGTRDVYLSRDDMQPEFNVVVNRDRLAFYGLNSATVGQAVRNRVNGLIASLFREDGEEYDIRVRYAEEHRTSLEDIENITIINNLGQGIKLRDVATIQEQFAPPAIERENRQRKVSVMASLADGVPLGTVVEAVNELVDNYELPDNIFIEVGGTVEDQAESFGDLGTLLILIIMLVYIVMATQFESLLMPFIIMFSLPFAFTGVFLALWLTGTPLSLIALIGAIMLVGIVVKNGIVLVDYINLLRERGGAINQSVIAAGKSRLRPVLMTSITTILGMVPMALGTGEGSEIWQPMGIAVIGGLTFSTLLTLLVVPVVYSIFGARELKKEKRSVERGITDMEKRSERLDAVKC